MYRKYYIILTKKSQSKEKRVLPPRFFSAATKGLDFHVLCTLSFVHSFLVHSVFGSLISKPHRQ